MFKKKTVPLDAALAPWAVQVTLCPSAGFAAGISPKGARLPGQVALRPPSLTQQGGGPRGVSSIRK